MIAFGLIGLASIGPVLAVLFLGMFSNAESHVDEAAEIICRHGDFGHFWELVPEVAYEVGMAIAPLVGLFILFRIILCCAK